MINLPGVRVVILHCEAVVAREVLMQAEDLAMTGPGWAWVVTDGTTGSEEQVEESTRLPEGLIGTSPTAEAGLLYGQFSRGWEEINAREANISGDLSVRQSHFFCCY